MPEGRADHPWAFKENTNFSSSDEISNIESWVKREETNNIKGKKM